MIPVACLFRTFLCEKAGNRGEALYKIAQSLSDSFFCRKSVIFAADTSKRQ